MTLLALIEWMTKPVCANGFCKSALPEMSSAGVYITKKKFIKNASVISRALSENPLLMLHGGS